MGTPDPEKRTSAWAVVAVAGAFVVCCAGPVLLALLATTGLGVVLAHHGASLVAAAGLVAALAVAAVMWQRRRACACQVLRRPSAPERSRGTDDGVAPPRRDRAGVP
jgi:hypothetical protein